MKKTRKFLVYSTLLTIVVLTMNSCNNDPTIPTLATLSATHITDSTAICGGVIVSNGDAPILEKGICYDTNPNPTIANSLIIDSLSADSISCLLTGLQSGNTYYARAYAKNSVGVGYGNEVSFTIGDLSPYLMAYYPFNGNANDASGKGNNGTIYGTLTPTTDRKGNLNSAYAFNGIDGYVEIPSSSYVKPTNAITLSTWFYLGATGKMFDDMFTVTYNGEYNPYSSYYICKMYDSLSFCITTGNPATSTIIRSGTKLNLNQWYHAVGTYDGNVMKLYLNGHLEVSAVKTGTITYNSNPLKLGHAVHDQFFTGKLDDMKVYNKALSENEVLQLYNE